MSHSKSFNIILLNMIFFLAGTANVRLSLVLFLREHHLPISFGFLIGTSMAAMQLVCMFIWPRFFKHYAPPSYSTLIVIGSALSAISVGLLYLYNGNIILLTLFLSLYVFGNSLFLINIRSLVSLHDQTPKERQHANQLFYLGMNMGGIFGLVGSSIILAFAEYFASGHTSYDNIYLMNFCLLVLATVYMAVNRKKVINPPSENTKKHHWPTFYAFVIVFYLYVWFLMNLPRLTQVVVAAFFICTLITAIVKRKSSGIPLIPFLGLILTNVIFWIALSVMYFHFCAFIHDFADLNLNTFTIPSFMIYVFDPLTCMLMGIIVMATKIGRGSPLTSFRIGFGLLMLAFFGFAAVMFFQLQGGYFIGFIIFAVLIYGLGEFLIAPSIMAQLANITPNKSNLRSLMGTLSLSTALANVLSYYVMKLSYNNSTDMRTTANGNLTLFAFLGFLLLSVWVIIHIVSLVKRIGETKKNGRTLDRKNVEGR